MSKTTRHSHHRRQPGSRVKSSGVRKPESKARKMPARAVASAKGEAPSRTKRNFLRLSEMIVRGMKIDFVVSNNEVDRSDSGLDLRGLAPRPRPPKRTCPCRNPWERCDSCRMSTMDVRHPTSCPCKICIPDTTVRVFKRWKGVPCDGKCGQLSLDVDWTEHYEADPECTGRHRYLEVAPEPGIPRRDFWSVLRSLKKAEFVKEYRVLLDCTAGLPREWTTGTIVQNYGSSKIRLVVPVETQEEVNRRVELFKKLGEMPGFGYHYQGNWKVRTGRDPIFCSCSRCSEAEQDWFWISRGVNPR